MKSAEEKAREFIDWFRSDENECPIDTIRKITLMLEEQSKEAREQAFLEAAEMADKIRLNAFIEPLQKMHPTQQIVLELRRKAREA